MKICIIYFKPSVHCPCVYSKQFLSYSFKRDDWIVSGKRTVIFAIDRGKVIELLDVNNQINLFHSIPIDELEFLKKKLLSHCFHCSMFSGRLQSINQMHLCASKSKGSWAISYSVLIFLYCSQFRFFLRVAMFRDDGIWSHGLNLLPFLYII